MTRALLAAAIAVFGAQARAQTFEVTGRVMLSDAPADLSGSTVRVGAPVDRTATTDAGGQYAIDGVPAGTYRIEASHAGYRTEVLPAVEVPAQTTVDFTLVRVFALTGRVVLADGREGPGGTQVTLRGPEGNRTATADAAGGFRFDDLVAGDYDLAATRPCYEMGAAQVRVPVEAEVILTLAADRHPVSGTVRLEGHGANLEGTQVTLDEDGERVANTLTNVLGRYVFEAICPGMYAVAASRRGYRPAMAAVTVNGPTVVPDLVLSRLGPFTLRGTVRLEGGGDPTGAEVALEGAGLTPVVVGADGAFRFDGVLFGIYTLVARLQGFEPSRVPALEIASDATVDLLLVRARSPATQGAGCCDVGGGRTSGLGVGAVLAALFALSRRRALGGRGAPRRLNDTK
jgi:hypothetical protein